MRRSTLVMILIPVLVLAGCGGAGGGTKGTGGTIEDIHWVLTTIDIQGEPKAIPDAVTIDATFADGSVTGSSGCNTYRGPYEIDGASLTAGPFSGTKMACPDPAGMLETAYLLSLAAADSYTATADTLTIYDIPGTALLVYKVAPAGG